LLSSLISFKIVSRPLFFLIAVLFSTGSYCMLSIELPLFVSESDF